MEDFADKTEAPTLHRREEARRLGNVPRSSDLAAAVLCLGAVLLLRQYGPRVSTAFQIILAEGLSATTNFGAGRIGYVLGSAVAPLLGGLVLLAVIAYLVQTGFIFRFRAQPIDPAKNFQRMFGGRSAAQLAMNVLKLALVGAVAYAATRGRIGEIVALQDKPFADAAAAAGSLMVGVALRVAGVLLVLGIVDYAYQRFRHERELRMTRREVKEEQRRLDGNPEAKRRRKQASATFAAARTERQVSSADVVVTGHDIAVAIKFDRATMLAPRVVAMGRGNHGSLIRETAERKAVTVVERDALAQALLRAVAVNRDVPQKLFAPVADVIAFAYELRQRQQQREVA